VRRFLAGLLLGVVGSLSISVGLIATILIFIVVVALGASIGSFSAVAGTLIGWGLAWLGFFYWSFGRSLCNGPGCGNGGEYLNFVLLSLGILCFGPLVGGTGLLRTVRSRRLVMASR
jgi:hypothetical protein